MFFKQNHNLVDQKDSNPVTNPLFIEPKVDPLTIDELDEAIQKRMSVIEAEFKAGFDFIKRYPKTVSFFGSARIGSDNPHYQKARDLAKLLAEKNYAVVTGGGPGIMEAANRGALEAGGRSLGLTIKLPEEQKTNLYLTDSVAFYYFFVRKVCLTFSAEAFVYFPGGFGTLDEFFEIITLIQTNKIPKAPIILVGADYWRPLDQYIKNELYEKHRAISEMDTNLYYILEDEKEIIDLISHYPVRIG